MEATLLTKVILPFSLFVIMLGMGLSLTLSDFKAISKTPKSLLIGISLQMILLPILAFGVVKALNLEPKLAVGLMVLSFCPGGVTSNMYSYLSNANVALSISLTAIISIVTPFTIPLLLDWQMQYFLGNSQTIEIPILKTIITLMVITIIPVGLGMAIKSKKSKLAAKADKPVKYLSLALLFVIIAGICLQNKDNLATLFAQTGTAALSLNLIAMVLAFYLAKFFGLNRPDQKTISIEVGLQNGTTALFVTSTLLQDPILSMPSATYALIMFATGTTAAYIFAKSSQS